MIRLFVFIGSLLVLALIAALAVPPFVNWNQFRDQFEAEAGRIIGQPVKVLGQTSARLLPLPSVTFEKIQIGEAGNGKSMLTAASFHLNMELAPLLKGDVVVVDMELVKPRVDVLIDRQGKINWNIKPGKASVDIAAEDISIDNIKISNGLLRVRDARFDREFILKDINANASARTVAGPWKVLGQISYLEKTYKVDAASGRWQRLENGDGRVRLKLGIAPKFLPYDVSFDGPFLLHNGEPNLSGNFKIKPMARQSGNDRINFPRPPRTQAVNARLSGTVELTPTEAMVPQFELKIGDRDDPYVIDGSVVTKFGEKATYEVRAEGQQVNLARFSNTPDTDATASTATSLAARIDTVRKLLDDIPHIDSNGKVFLSLPAIITGDTIIRDVELEATPLANGAGWDIENLKAQLPGRTEVRANGRLNLGESFGYEGALVIASRQPSGLAKWLGQGEVPALLNLTSAGISATANLTAEKVVLDNLEVALGAKQLLGRFERIAETGDKKAHIVTELQGDVVDLDQLTALFNLFSGNRGAALDHDISLKLKANKVRLRGVEAEKVDVQLATNNGRIAVPVLNIASLAGAGISASGSLSGFPGKQEGQMNGNLSSANPVRFLRLIQSTWGPLPLIEHFIENPETITDTDLAFDVKAGGKSGDGMAISLGGFTGGSSLKVNVFSKYSHDDDPVAFVEQQIKVSLLVDNPQSSRLLAQLGMPVLPLDVPGSGRLQLEADGVLANGMNIVTSLNAASVEANANGKLNLTSVADNYGWVADLQVTAKSQDLDSPIMLSGLPIPGFGLGMKGDIRANIKFENRNLSILDISAQIDGAEVSGNLLFDNTHKPRQLVTGTLQIDEIAAGIIPRLVFSETVEAQQEETSLLSDQLFSGLDGKIVLGIDRLILTGELPAQKVTANLSIQDGDVSFDEFSADWLGGKFAGNLSLSQSEAARLMNGQITFQNADAKRIQDVLGMPTVLQGRLNGHLSLEGAGRTADKLVAGLTGSGTFSVADGVINGLHQNALSKILQQADQSKNGKKQLDSKAVSDSGLFEGSFPFDPVRIPFSITSGSVRANSILLKNEKMALNSTVKYEIASQILDVDAKIRFRPGREAVIGASPDIQLTFSGPGQTPIRTIDTSALTSFLGMRRAERREREFETQKSNILEKQRLARLGRQIVLDRQARLRREEERRIQEARLEEQRLEAERLEAERLEAERLEAERLEAERLEAERLEAVRLEAERLEAERMEAERLKAERLAAEKVLEEKRIAAQVKAKQLEKERLEAAQRQKLRDAEKRRQKNEARREAERQKQSQKIAPNIIETLKDRVRQTILESR